jgi:hypothetical protein
MRRIFFVFMLSLVLSLTSPLVHANGRPTETTKYQKLDKATLDKVMQKVTFTLLTPQQIPTDWTIELKYPYPLDINRPIQRVMLHFFDKNENFLIGIEQRSARGTELNSYRGEQVQFNGNKALFEGWANKGEILNGHLVRGGYLRWVQEDTFIKMYSQSLTKQEMISVARSLARK